MRRRLAEARELPRHELDDPVDQLQLIVYQLMLAQQDDRAATVAFAREIVRFAEEDVMAEVRAMRDEYTALVTEIIRRGVERGAFAEVDPALAALQVFGMCNWSWTWFEPGGRRSATEIADRVLPHPDRRPRRRAAARADCEALAERGARATMAAHRADGRGGAA